MNEKCYTDSGLHVEPRPIGVIIGVMVDVPIRCECGAVQGRLRTTKPGAATRLVCYCKDCQAFAHYLGCAEATLNANGGTEICQLAPRELEFGQGVEALACLRLTPSGPLRWYAKCCHTPIAITPASRRVSFAGMVLSCVARAPAMDAEAAFGPVRMHIFKQSATGERRALDGLPGMKPARMLSLALRMCGALLSGRHRLNPFFDAGGAPIASPHALTDAERAKLAPYSHAA